jgi:hypothetical protein
MDNLTDKIKVLDQIVMNVLNVTYESNYFQGI